MSPEEKNENLLKLQEVIFFMQIKHIIGHFEEFSERAKTFLT
jgi:hypothetical protein